MDRGELKFRQRGALMIEVLVSSLIGTLMLYGALSVMLNSRTTYLARDSLSRIEERGRLALDLLAEDIRSSGYRGCVSGGSQPIVSAVNNLPAWMQPELGVRGWNYTTADFNFFAMNDAAFSSASWAGGGGATAKGTSTDIVQESDVIELWMVHPYVMDITATDVDDAVKTLVAEPNSVAGITSVTATGNSGDLVLVSDCSRNILVKASSIDESSGVITLDASSSNDQIAQLGTMTQAQAVVVQGIMYFLAIPSYGTRPSLYRKEIKADGTYKNKVEVLPGILNVQFLYGENTDSSPDVERYVEAQAVTNWANVVSVRIFLLVETENNNVVPQGQDFYYFGGVFAPESDADRRIRRQYSTTVTLRNRSLGLIVSSSE